MIEKAVPLWALAVVVVAGCGAPRSASAVSSWPYSGVHVQVENDLVPRRGHVSIRLLSSDGRNSILGGVSPGEEGRFRVRDGNVSGDWVLSATTAEGDELRSRTFRLFPGATVVWRLQHNELQVVTASALRGAGRAVSTAPPWPR